MIQFTPSVIALLNNPAVEIIHLVSIGPTYRTTSHYDSVTLSDGTTYSADGHLLNVDSPRLSAAVDREIFRVTLADDDYGLSIGIGEGLVGAKFEVKLALVDPVTKAIQSNIADVIIAYKGIVDSIAYAIQPGNIGSVVLSVSGASPMADLDSTRAYSGSRDYMKSINKDDTSFDQVYEGSGSVALKWGKG